MNFIKILKQSGFKRTINGIVNYGEYYLRRKKLISYPVAVDLEVTTRCPLACVHCVRTWRDEINAPFEIGDFPRDKAVKLLRQLKGVRRITLQGYGEPIVYPYLFDLIDEARKLKIFTAFSTSGAYVNDEILKRLIDSPPDLLTFSCDAIDMRYDEGVRENLDLEKFRVNVSKIIESVRKSSHKTEILFHSCIVGDNYKHLSSIVRFASEMEVNTVDISELNLSYLERWEDRLLPDSRSKMLESVEEAKREGKRLKVKVGFTPQENLPEELRRGCRYLWQHPFITWQGDVTPCCGRPFGKTFKLGNVNEQPFKKIFNNAKAQSMRSMLVSGKIPSICRGCPYAPSETEDK